MQPDSRREETGSRRTAAALALMAGLSLLASMACGEGSRELLANGGFESLNAEGGAENWGMRDWGETKFAAARVTGGARFGQRCLELRATSGPLLFGCFSHPISLGDKPPDRLILTLSYRADGATNPEIVVATFSDDFAVKEWNTPVLTAEAVALDNTPRWRTITWHVRPLPSARQAVVMARIHGPGSLLLDGMSLQAYPADVECALLATGTVVNLKGDRQARLRLTNRTEAPLPVRIALQIKSPNPKVKPRTAQAQARLTPGQPQEVTIGYSFPLGEAAMLAATVTSETGEVTYDEIEDAVPGLIDGWITSPAFRATVLPGIPQAELAAHGTVNATPELRRQLKLDGRLVGLGQDLPEIPLDEDGRWQVRVPLGPMLTGSYALRVRALQAGKPVAEFELPLLKPEPKPNAAGYDERLRLVTGATMRLPLGVFMAVDEADLAAVAEAGFNTVVLPSRLAGSSMMEQAQKLGLAVIISSASAEVEYWQGLMGRHGEVPGLAGWYVLQRPEGHSPPAPPALMGALYSGIAKLDPRHPVCLAVSSLSRLEHYSSYCDILMPWTEPEPVGDLRAVDVLLRRARELCGDRRPIWPMIQMTGAAYATDARLDPAGNGRPPTPDEYRCMAYLSLARGAQGLFSYAFRVAATAVQRDYLVSRDAPELWQAARRVNQELRAIAPVLLEGDPVAAECAHPAVAVRGFRYKDAFYVLAANPLSETATISLRVPGMKSNVLEVAFDNRKVQGLAAGEFADQLEPRGVRVYMGR